MVKSRFPVWDSTAIIQLRYFPFRAGDETERGVLDYLTKRLISVARNECRTRGVGSGGFKQNFTQSRCLVGIDVASIRDSQVSYLDNLTYLIRVYPFVLVNSCLSPSVLQGLQLHQMLRDKHYILPVFGRIPSDDPIWSKHWYGKEFFDLLAGKEEKLSCRRIPAWETKLRADDVCQRYNLNSDGSNLSYSPSITWLGVESEKLAEGLTTFFNEGIEEFEISDFLNRFPCSEDLLKSYLEESMLFSHIRAGKYRFRLARKTILLGFMYEIAQDFEERLVATEAIDTTHSNYAAFPQGLIEYHSVGKLFDPRDTYALSLLSYVRQQLSDIDYNCVALVDNGKERALYDLIPKIFDGVKVVRIINYFGTPMISPFDEIGHDDNVLLVTDLVNSGRFMEASLRLLKDKTGHNCKAAYSFIVGVNFNSKALFDEGHIDPNGRFAYYVSKKLDRVIDAKLSEHNLRFGGHNADVFSLFWHTINRVADCRKAKHVDERSMRIDGGDRINSQVVRLLDIDFRGRFIENAEDQCPFYSFLKRHIAKNSIRAAIILEDKEAEGFRDALLSIDSTLKACIVDPNAKKYDGIRSLSGNDSIGIFCMAIDIGHALEPVIAETKRVTDRSTDIHVISMFRRKNAILNTEASVERCLNTIEGACKSITCFYDSCLPYYFMGLDSERHRHFRRAIEDVFGNE